MPNANAAAGITTTTRPTGQRLAPSTRAELARHANNATQIAHDPPHAQVIGSRSTRSAPAQYTGSHQCERRAEFEKRDGHRRRLWPCLSCRSRRGPWSDREPRTESDHDTDEHGRRVFPSLSHPHTLPDGRVRVTRIDARDTCAGGALLTPMARWSCLGCTDAPERKSRPRPR